MLHNDPSSPIVWLTHAKSDLLLSKFYDSKEILLNQLCYHAQQSVEKSIKAILIQSKVNFKFTHNIKNLIASLPQEIENLIFQRLTNTHRLCSFNSLPGRLRRNSFE